MSKTAQKLFLFVSVIFSSLTSTTAQTIIPEYRDVFITPDNFVTGTYRRCAMDVQKSTGKTVYVYAEKEANPATTKDLWCVIYDRDMTILVNPFRINTQTVGDQLAPFVAVHQNDNAFYVSWYSNQSGDNDIYIKKISLDITDATSASVLSQADKLVNNTQVGDQNLSALTISYTYNEVICAFRDQSGNDGGGTGSYAVFGRRMAGSDLAYIGNQFLFHSFTSGNQVLNAIDIKANKLVITFASNHVTENAYDIYARVYDVTDPPGPTPVTYTPITEFRVNNYLPGDQNNSHLSINSVTGELAITWSSVQDGSGWGAYSKIYSNTNTVVKDEFLVNSVTINNELLSKVIWEESTKQLLYFFHYSVSSLGTLKYRIFDGATIPGQYNPVNADQDLIGGLNTKSYFNQFYNIVYNPYTNRINLVYDIYDSYSTFNSKTRARTFIFKHPNLATPYFVNNTDLNRNWVHQRTYAEDGSLISETRQYYDSTGNSTQSQARNVAENGTILASTKINDVYNRAVLQTLIAPIPEKAFTFRNDLITPAAGSSRYHYNDFDKPATVGNLSGEVNNPKTVNINSLSGKYYSDSNAYEAFVGNTGFPYARVNHNDKIYGGVVSTSSPGEALKMGSGREQKSIMLPVLNELDHYLQLKKLHFGASNIPATTMAFKAVKTISVDENGLESIVFTDLENHKIAVAKANSTSPMTMSGDLSYNTSFLNVSASPYLTVTNLKISSSADLIEVRTLQDDALVFSGYSVDFNLFPFFLSNMFQIRSRSPFKVSYTTTNNLSVVNHYSNVPSSELSEGHPVLDLYLKDPSSLSLSLSAGTSLPFGSTLGIKVSNLKDGTVHYSGDYASFSYTVLPAGAGFYRIELDQVPALTDYTPSSIYLRVNFNFPYSDWSYYFYNLRGNVVGTVAPNGVNTSSTASPKFQSKYTYSTIGTLVSSTDPDRGTTYYVYRKDGKLRFAQNALQAVTGRFSYMNFDALGRIVESGEYDPSLVISNAKIFVNQRAQDTTSTPDPNSIHTVLENSSSGGGLEAAGCTQVNVIVYSDAVSDALRTQRFTRLKTSCTYRKNISTDTDTQSKTWYSYDERGRVEWMDQSLNGLTGTKTIDYTYTRELLTNVVYQKNTVAERFEHKYSYDAMQRLKKLETAAGAALFKTEAQYYYYLHGPLKRKELGKNVQGIDYVYTVQGWLKSINHPELSAAKDPGHDGAGGSAFPKDVFGISFDYYQNDYVRANSNIGNSNESSLSGFIPYYNGNIRGITWQTAGQSISGNPCQYLYTYDYKYQLLTAVFGSNNTSTKNFTPDATGKYGTNASYDLNGNLLTLNNQKGAVTGDQYTYKFGLPATPEYSDPVSNKLQYLINGLNTNDIRTYQYDEIGQLINETRGSGAQKKLAYDSYGKVIEVRDAANVLKVSFTYNERGQRIKKVSYGAINIVTWYLVDATGNVVTIYDNKSGTTAQTEIPMYGAGCEGVVQKNGSSLVYTYELKDHLGNVRATVDSIRQGGELQPLSWMDYLAFGEVNPERHSYGAYANRHEYQGEYAEHDNETEWEAFELRMYDARIGRWLSVDPMNQYWSPYVAMGNNLIIMIDPSGGTGGPGINDGGNNNNNNGNGPPIGTSYSDAYGKVYDYTIDGWAERVSVVGISFGQKSTGDTFGARDMMGVSAPFMFTGDASMENWGHINMPEYVKEIRGFGKFLGDISETITYTIVAIELGTLYIAPESLPAVIPLGGVAQQVNNTLDLTAEAIDVSMDLVEGKWISAGTKIILYPVVEAMTFGYAPKNAIDNYVVNYATGFITDQINQTVVKP